MPVPCPIMTPGKDSCDLSVGWTRPWAVIVPGNPIPLERNRHTRFASYLPPRSTAYRQLLHIYFRRQMALDRIALTHQLLNLEVRFYRDSNRPCDIDNLLKSCFDALSKVVIFDDKQIMSLVAEKLIDKKDPRMVLTLSPK